MTGQEAGDTWPFQLVDRIESAGIAKVYPYIRGMGGATIRDVQKPFLRDLGYFKKQGGDSKTVVIFNMGIVDSAPRPFTHHLKQLSRLPLAGPAIWYVLAPALNRHRALLQRISWFRLTSPRRFQKTFTDMVGKAKRISDLVISIDTPLTPEDLESRSPGLRNSIILYNHLKHQADGVQHVAMDFISEEHYLECGHHFNKKGHLVLADITFKMVASALYGEHHA